ncbi:hypothetical protein DM02DRAFT_701953 [Periconia macrospinosa]|uniref:FabD/lysophospholipase-like protein n=1 Tax=Periconia macrospinosa TaxID=97972 RepID=A0A2V1DZV4_9PLEO|nr:hypothetical protein DM02DRAFT_701953 [Periconia macrospinosa]
MSEAESEDQPPKICESCEQSAQPIWNCAYCDMNFCDSCWSKQGPHKLGRTGPDGLPHEKTNPKIIKRLKDILSPPSDQGAQETLHVEDEDTTWFGLARDTHNKPFFQDYGRYASIMADSNTVEHQSRYPQLVSFIGQTGAGKSTLIKMLIDQQERVRGSRQYGFPSPVVGSVTHGNLPTSGDVHLYSDPGTYASAFSMLLADCEGLEGGENIPISAQYREKSSRSSEKKGRDSNIRKRISKSQNQTRREIKWADTPEKSKRQYAVTELYPRLLYTFSDVIVFVLRNPKTFESTVLSLLIDWARSSIEKSLNQPTLPHAIIALNATDTRIDPKVWDTEYATNSLMSDVSGAIHRDPNYQELKSFWVARGKHIENMKDLLECYYSSITVVRVPGDGRYMMIDKQVQTLYDAISRRCKESFHAKRKSRMVSNSEHLNIYLQTAFDHFSNDLHTPFNFMDISFKINPIPLDFGGNILKLAVAMKSRFSSAEKIFEELSFMVASCILLDCARQSFRGPADQILEKHYLIHCDTALEDFCASYWPCSFQNKNGEFCMNVQGSHNKGHQNSKGKVMSTGQYRSSFTFEKFGERWLQFLNEHLAKLQHDLNIQLMQPPTANEIDIVTKMHHANIELFYHRLGGAQMFVSHQTCFCCLRELAEHPLPCGHVLCSPCIKSYGKPHVNVPYSYSMASCPLHQVDTVFASYWPVYFKPPLAGVRILSLDGGGMRGIVILEVLRKIEDEMGGRIPIQDFFDLVVGTSTGGIIALALGIKNWSVEHCSKSFTSLVTKAFTKRYPGGFRLSKSRYQTKPFEGALLDAFGEEAIFAGVPDDRTSGSPRKVAVTAATETGAEAVIFTNYNRASSTPGIARATSAAPTYFKPFTNSRTKETFLDGAVYYNNPVRIANFESKLIWPDAEGRHPDILLSIGTAYHEPRNENKKRKAAMKPFPEVKAWYDLFKKRVENELNAELAWDEFCSNVVGTSSPIAAQRYVRLNPKMASPVPKMDDTEEYHLLRAQVGNKLTTPHMKILIQKTAHRLIASSFYFEKNGPVSENNGSMTVQGTIRCRFAAESENLRRLGEHIKSRFNRRSFQPFFRVHEVVHNEQAQDIKLDRQVLEDMIDVLEFRMSDITIPISTETALITIDLHLTNDPMKPHLRTGFPISGFPRSLVDEEAPKRTTSPPPSPTPTPPSITSKRQSLRSKKLGRPASEGDVPRYRKENMSDSQPPLVSQATGHEHTFKVSNQPSELSRSRSYATRNISETGSMSSMGSLKQLDEAVGRYIAGPAPPYELDDGAQNSNREEPLNSLDESRTKHENDFRRLRNQQ